MRLVDVRVPLDDLKFQDWKVTWQLRRDDRVFDIDLAPPAAGPEAQITFQGVSNLEARHISEAYGLTVLTSRTRHIKV